MLKYALICLALGVAASPSYALSRSTLESKETVRPASPRPWVISAEYAGRAGLYSLNLDAQFTPDWGVGGGLSVWNSAVFSKLNSAKFVIVPVYANYYWRLSGKHRIYSTLGAS